MIDRITTFSKEYRKYVIDNSTLSEEDEVGYIDTQESIFVGGAIDKLANLESEKDYFLEKFNTRNLFYILYLVEKDYEDRKIRLENLERKDEFFRSHEELLITKQLIFDIKNLITTIATEHALTTYSRGKGND